MSSNFMILLAQAGGETSSFPFIFQAIAVVNFALFLLSFSVFRNPRSWRRLFQSFFSKKGDFSVNRNKHIDEKLKKRSIVVAMIFLMICAASLIYGATHKIRQESRELSKEERIYREDIERVRGFGG